jgi:hypothetical protein
MFKNATLTCQVREGRQPQRLWAGPNPEVCTLMALSTAFAPRAQPNPAKPKPQLGAGNGTAPRAANIFVIRLASFVWLATILAARFRT